ncbi:MAG: LptF/LptG family permease, partial [Campylobacterales bacterium]|nr:LptF/LptG family permease [Campylobacterales bacterium]
MSTLSKYLISIYIKYFLVLLFSLEIFFIGINLIQNFKELPNSANLQLLYLMYNSFFTLTITLPLSLVFAWILTLSTLIKSNELVSLYALGLSKFDILKPILLLSGAITIFLISLHTTPLAYSYDEQRKIINNQYFSNEQENIFLKYDNFFVYFKKLYP